MKDFRFQIIILYLFILNSILYAENPCGTMYPVEDTTSWGIGFIRLPDNIQIKGNVVKDNSICYIGKDVIRFSNDSAPKIKEFDYVYLGGFNSILLKVFEIRDTKYKICSNTISGAIWVDYNELTYKGLYFNTYPAILAKYKCNITDDFGNTLNWANIGVNLLKSCLYLRTEPSTNGKIITCLKNNYSGQVTKIVITQVDGDWAKIIANVFVNDSENDESGEGCSLKLIYDYKGYIKLLDDNGRPNIWYSRTSY